MKTNILRSAFVALILAATSPSVHAQTSACTFISPTVDLQDTMSNVGGNCLVTMDLSWVINHNNGNKYTVLHLWPYDLYPNPTFPYAVNYQPTVANGGLANAVLTLVIDRTGTTPVFMTNYNPDPSINNTILKDAGDGLTLQVIDLGNSNFYYKVSNVQVSYPGACNSLIKFKGDAWSSNAASLNCQCSMTGFTYLSNAPLVQGAINCNYPPAANGYTVNISSPVPGFSIDYSLSVYVDVDDNGTFNPLIDNILIDSFPANTLADVTFATTYSSGSIPYTYSATWDNKFKDLFLIVGNIVVTDLSNNTTTAYQNTIFQSLENNCAPVLPITFESISAVRNEENVTIKFSVNEDDKMNRYEIERSTNNKLWSTVADVTAKQGNGMVEYSVLDKNNLNQNCYYRIKAIDKGGIFNYSKIIKVNGLNTDFAFTVAPNPTNSVIKYQLNIGAAESVNIRLMDIQGKTIQQKTAQQSGSFEMNQVSPGLYVLAISNSNGSQTQYEKVVVE